MTTTERTHAMQTHRASLSLDDSEAENADSKQQHHTVRRPFVSPASLFLLVSPAEQFELGGLFLVFVFLEAYDRTKEKKTDIKHTNWHRVKTCNATLVLTFWIHYGKKS